MLTENLMAINGYTKELERNQINDLTMLLNNLEKEGQTTPKIGRKKK